MADLGNRANVNSAIDLLLDDLQPDEAIQPSDHNVLLKDILDTLANGLSTVLRTGNTTDGENLTITSSSIFQFANGSNGRLQSDTLTAFRNWTLPDTTGTIALLSDIPSADNIYTADGTTGTGRVATLTDTLTFKDGTVNIQGAGTSTGSALSIYDNDTTPNKLWDFLDNGNIGVNQSSSFLLSANKTLKVDASLNTSQNIFELNGSTNAFGTGAITVGAYGNIEVKGTNSSGNFKVLTMLGNEYFTLDGNGNNTTLRTKAFDLGASSTTGYKMSYDAGRHQFIRGGIVGAYFNLVNSSVQFWEAGMTSRKFIVGGSALVGTEQISLQGDTLLNANVKIPNLPTLSTGTVVGDVWSQNGTVKIGNPSANITTVASVGGLTVNADTTEMAKVLALATNITINAPTGTPNDNQSLWFRILDNGTSRTITLNAVFEDYTGNFPTSTTAGKYLIFAGKWSADEGKWNILAWKVQP